MYLDTTALAVIIFFSILIGLALLYILLEIILSTLAETNFKRKFRWCCFVNCPLCSSLMRTKHAAKCREIECSVCLEEFDNNEKIKALKCGHEYHKKCILESLKHKEECPVCKQSVYFGKKLMLPKRTIENKFIYYFWYYMRNS